MIRTCTMLGLRHSGRLRPSIGNRKRREVGEATNLILAAIAAAETESNYCLVLSAKNSSRRCRNRLSYSIAANADRARSSTLSNTLAAQVPRSFQKFRDPRISCALETGSSKRVLNRLGQCAHNTIVDMTLPTFLVHAVKTLPSS